MGIFAPAGRCSIRSVGGCVDKALPLDKKWWGGTGWCQSNQEILDDSRKSHEWGFHHTFFTIDNLEGQPGFELARKYPEYILRDSRGGYVGYYMTAKADPVKLADFNNRYPEWSYVNPNFYNHKVLEWALDSLTDAITYLECDGVYFDGRYFPREGFDHTGADMAKRHDTHKKTIENMKYSRTRLRKANPKCYIWSNGADEKDPQSEMYNDPNSGALLEIQDPFITDPNRAYHSWRGLMEACNQTRNSFWTPSKGSLMNSKIIHMGYIAVYNDPELREPTRGFWPYSSHVASIIAANAFHPIVFGEAFRPFVQMMTRYSEFYWHEDVNLRKNAYKEFNVDGLREVWWEDSVYYRETPGYTDYYVHLVNTSDVEKAVHNIPNDPSPADDIEVSTALIKDLSKVKAWAIQPYGYGAKIYEPVVKSVGSQKVEKEVVFAVPEFKYYTLLVIRDYK